MSLDHVTVRTASTVVRAIVIALSVAWVAILAWVPGRWILRLWRRRGNTE
jgi:hypothetical protein